MKRMHGKGDLRLAPTSTATHKPGYIATGVRFHTALPPATCPSFCTLTSRLLEQQ